MSHHTSCKYCGRGMLTWKQINGKWRMVDSNDAVHICQSLIQAKREEARLRSKYHG